MQSNAKNNKKGPQPVYKPYLRGRAFSKTAVKRCWRILGYTLIFTVLYVIVGSALAFDNTALRVICNGVVLLMVMGLMYNDGARMGESDTAFAEIAMNRKNEGKNVPRRARVYHRADLRLYGAEANLLPGRAALLGIRL